jgi:phosphoglycan beta-1,3-galactosyltransferase
MFNVGDVTRRNVPGDANAYPNTQSDTNCIHSTMAYHSRAHSPIASSRGALPPIVTTANPTARSAKSRYNDEVHTPTTHYIESRLFAAAPVRLRRRLRIHKRSVALGLVALLLLFSFVFFDFLYDRIVEFYARPASTAAAEVWGVEEFDAPTGARSVLVQHHGAMDRLNVTLPEEDCALPPVFCSTIRLSPQLLPSWTLHMVRPQCTWCSDAATYGQAVKGVTLVPEHAVFATSSAPLGRIGPMLFAMSSVTDDIPLSLELPHWMWMRHVYPNYAEVSWEKDAAPDVAPYLAVMGIPSTDQPARVALRTAQRATWMSYQEVARTENNFEGALLPLYLFAAVEPAVTATTTSAAPGQAGKIGDLHGTAAPVTTVDPYTYVNASSIAPTVREFEYATQARAATTDNEESVHYTHRRVNLQEGWDEEGDAEAAAHSPCGRITTYTVDEDEAPSALTTLTTTLGMRVTPAFVAGAQYICHASAALWKEALTYRNVVWIDMMTDRRPTTHKKLGDTGKWGLPVEVGMSQKLILWLEYAYHAFPDVPYIIKGDDDAYLKVPQFLSDVRRVVADAMSLPNKTSVISYLGVPFNNATTPPQLVAAAGLHRKNTVKGALGQGETATATLVTANSTPCLYWGSLRLYNSVRFAAGMTLMLHRNMARAVLSPSLRQRGVDVVKLATHTYHRKNTRAYRRSMFHREDMLLGLLLNSSISQSQKFCAHGRIFFVKEGYPRFHDVHVGKTHDVTWSTVVAHHCSPADHYYLHYFNRNEHRFATAALPLGVTVEAHAMQRVKEWVREQQEALPAEVAGWNALPVTVWKHPAHTVPSYDVDEVDQVAVYYSVFHRMQHLQTHVQYGYYAEPGI